MLSLMMMMMMMNTTWAIDKGDVKVYAIDS